jgi:hypothetical protein
MEAGRVFPYPVTALAFAPHVIDRQEMVNRYDMLRQLFLQVVL